MTKAERRKRSRERRRERERASEAAVATDAVQGGGVGALEVATAFAEPEPAVHQAATPTESEFITGPVQPRLPGPARAVVAIEAAPLEVEDEDDEDDDEEGEDEDDEDDEDGDEDDGEALDEEDALFNLACAAVEEGDGLTWNELVTWVGAAEVTDPRLALLATLLVTEENATEPPKLTGARVLEVLGTLGLGEIADEARRTVAAAPKGEDESPEERLAVREGARELATQAKRELSGKSPKPMKASDVRSAQAGRTAR